MTFTKMDMTRLGKNFGYMIRSLPMLDEDKCVGAGKAVVEHHFDCHDYCGSWCIRKSHNEQQRKEKKRYYRCKTKDKKLCLLLTEMLEKFITLDRLKEVAHGMDTQVNESFNNTASWFAPKNKAHCGSQSLRVRIAMALGINSVGALEYFEKLFAELGITMTDGVRQSLRVKETVRMKRLAKVKTTQAKKKRKEAHFKALKQQETNAKKERAKRDGTHRRGMNLDDNDELNFVTPTNKKGPSQRVCPHCGKKGHSTTRSKKCDYYNGGKPDPPHHQQVPLNDPPITSAIDPPDNALDMERHDSMPPQDDDSDLDLFMDAGTGSEDENGRVMECGTL